MNIFYLANYAIFAAVLTAFSMEIAAALFASISYERFKDSIAAYIAPLWGINGTFIVFYLVNFEATFPNLLAPIGTMFILPAMLIALLIILRNTTIISWELHPDAAKEKRSIRVYSAVTALVGFVAIAVLSAGVSGIGVNFAASTANIATVLFNPYDILMFIAILLIAYTMGCVHFKRDGQALPPSLSAIVAIFLVLIASSISARHIVANVSANLPFLAAVVALLIATLVLYKLKSRAAGVVSLIWLYSAVLFFGFLEYPYIFGSVNSAVYTPQGTAAVGLSAITVIGGSILIASLALLLYSRRKAKSDMPAQVQKVQ